MKTSLPAGFRHFGKLFALTLALAIACLMPNFGRAASGSIYLITSNPELEDGTKGSAGFLRSLGYTVTVEPAGGGPYRALDTAPNAAQLIAELEAYNLILIHRNFGSGTLNSSATERGIWNKLRVPLLLCNAPIARGNAAVWRWYDGQSGSVTAPKTILIEAPGAHPIVAGLTGSLFNNDRIYGGVLNGTDGGTNMTILARVNLPAFGNPICLAVWDEAPGGNELRGFYAAGAESYYRRRVFFELHEYRNNSDAAINDAWLEVTANGRLLFANAVQFTMYGVVTPPPFINNLTPTNKTANYVASGGLSFDAASPLLVPDSGIVVKLNGSNVAAGLVFSGASTNRHVSYTGLLSNLVYNVEVTVSNVTGSRAALAQFDTFVPGQATILSTSDGVNYNGNLPAGNYHVYLQVAANTAQVLTFHRGTSASSGLQGILGVPNTGSLDPSTYTFVPLTDAVGNLSVLRLSGAQDFLLDPVNPVQVYPNDLVFAPASGVPATLPPILALASPAANAANASPLTALDLAIVNRDSSVVPGSIRLRLAGSDVTSGSTVTTNADGADVHYQPPVFLAPSSNYPVMVTFSDNLANGVTNQYSFLTRSMPAIPAAFATPVGSGTNRGFNIRNHMALSQANVNFTNTAARVELQLAGQFLNPGGQPITNAINGTPFAAPFTNETVINYGSILGGNRGWFPDDLLFPGTEVVGATNVAFEATAFLELKAGINRFGVKSTDGFRLTAGSGLEKDKQTVLIGIFDASRGEQVPTEGAFLVYQNGLYAFRLLYHKNGGSDVSLEWYSRTNDVEFANDQTNVGDRTLVNGLDLNGDTPTPAFRQRASEPLVPSPAITIARANQQVVLSWASAFAFQLQSNTNLSTPTWVAVAQTPTANGDQKTVQVPLTGQAVFYRLRY